MVQGSVHFPVYRCDTAPHKATGNKAMTLWDKFTGDCLLGLSQVSQQNLNICVPQQAQSFLELLPAFASAEQGLCCHLPIPLMVATRETRRHIKLAYSLWKDTHIHTNTERVYFQQHKLFSFVCLPSLLTEAKLSTFKKQEVFVSTYKAQYSSFSENILL